MSKYDNALAIKRRNDLLAEKLENQRSNSHRDKTGLRWRFQSRSAREMIFTTHCYHGYYGDSSAASDDSDELGAELAITLTELKEEIVSRTLLRLSRQTREAMVAAREEAESILTSIPE